MECGGKVRAADGDAAVVVRGAREVAWSWFRHKPKRRRWRRTPKEGGGHAVAGGGDGVTMTRLGQISAPMKRLRFLLRRQPTEAQRQRLMEATQVSFLPMEAIGESGELKLSEIREKEDVSSGYTLFFDGDVVVAKITPCFENGKGALMQGLLNGVGFGTTELHVLSPGPEVDGRFLYYVSVSEPFRKQGEAGMTGAAGQKRVPEDFVKDFRFNPFPLGEQRAIAAYLDRETARLDGLVAAKERVLGLLAEKRRALITRAVTRGVDDAALWSAPAERSDDGALTENDPTDPTGVHVQPKRRHSRRTPRSSATLAFLGSARFRSIGESNARSGSSKNVLSARRLAKKRCSRFLTLRVLPHARKKM